MERRKNGEEAVKRAEKPVVTGMETMTPMQPMPEATQPVQQMPEMPMPQAFHTIPATGTQMPVICCPLIMNRQCPMLAGQMGMQDPVMMNPYMAAPYMGYTYMADPWMTGQYMSSPYTCGPYMNY